MKAVDRYLYRHNNGTYYYRYTFPAFLTHTPFEVIISLKTKDIYQANSAILSLRIITNRIIEGFNTQTMRKKLKTLSEADLKMIVRDYIKECLKRIRVQIQTGNDYYNALAEAGEESPDLKQINWIDSKAYLTPNNFKYQKGVIEELEDSRDEKGKLRFPELGEVEDFNESNNPAIENPSQYEAISWLYLKHDISSYVSEGATPYKKLMKGLKPVFSYLEYAQLNEKHGDEENFKNFDDWCEVQKAAYTNRRRNIALQPEKVSYDNSKILSELLVHYLDESKPQKSSTTTIDEKQMQISFLIELIGDIPINELDGIKAQKVKQVLLKFPSNSKKRYPNLSVKDILALDIPEEQRFNTRTINKYIQGFSTFVNWAKNNHHYKGENPFSKMSIKTTNKSKRDERQPFSSDDLIKIFSSPVYQGCAGNKNNQRYMAGNIILHKSLMFWVTLIALFSGLRRSEICGLYLKDIKIKEGIWFFDINEEGLGKKAKSWSTIRELPIHKKLIEFGFLDLVEELKGKGEERLFPDLRLDLTDSYGDAFGKKFSYFIKIKLDIKGGNKSFHSLRHNVTDAIRRAGGCPNDIAHYITGHSFNESVQSRYGSKPDLIRVKEWVDKIEYPEISELLQKTLVKIKQQNAS